VEKTILFSFYSLIAIAASRGPQVWTHSTHYYKLLAENWLLEIKIFG